VIYDPLGIMSPITVRAKIFMQLLWKQNIDWDQTLPEILIGERDNIRLYLVKGTETEIPRWYFSDTSADTEYRIVHVFTDASQKAYGACAYIVSGANSSLIMSRNRVAPLKPISIPRLELMGAVVGARLCEHILSNVKCSRVYLWSDSMIVLSWLKSNKKQPVFVSNRVKEIKELTKDYEWHYCPTKSNPADLLSRGISAD
jgi:ribonuclease HI